MHARLNIVAGDLHHTHSLLEDCQQTLKKASPLIDMAQTWVGTSSKFKGFFKR